MKKQKIRDLLWRLECLYYAWPAMLYTPVLWVRGVKIRRKFDKDDIPEGPYCYHYSRSRGRCPFFDHNRLARSQSYGYCHYLKAGDWQYKGTFLLWDQCKECGENDDLEPE